MSCVTGSDHGSALLLTGLTNTTSSLRPVLELLPACRSPHRSPDWSNRPWTPRPWGPRCGPEIGQTPNDRAPHHEDEPIATQGWWPKRSTACKEKVRTWRVEGQTDNEGCLDNADTQNSTGDWCVKTWTLKQHVRLYEATNPESYLKKQTTSEYTTITR